MLQRIKSNVCPKCDGFRCELASDANCYRAHKYKSYERCDSESDNYHTIFENLGIDLEKNVFHEPHHVLAPGLHQPDLLHTVYLGLFNHLMDLIEGFLKKHAQLQAFDDTWKVLRPYLRFFVRKKAYSEVSQWQGKEIRILGPFLVGILAVALRPLNSRQVIPFNHARDSLLALVAFNIMAQYQSHTHEIIA